MKIKEELKQKKTNKQKNQENLKAFSVIWEILL